MNKNTTKSNGARKTKTQICFLAILRFCLEQQQQQRHNPSG